MSLRLLASAVLVAGPMFLGACAPAGPAADTTIPEAGTSPTLSMATPAAGDPGMGPTAAGSTAAQSPEEAFVAGGPRFVSAAALAQALDAGSPQIVVVDARPAADYEFGHIPGAVNVPYNEPEAAAAGLPKDAWIVSYCECPHAEAEQVADYLEQNGYTQVRVIDEGLQGWKDLGREVVGGTAAPIN
jgi:rhodanese-related sulfurtransferase